MTVPFFENQPNDTAPITAREQIRQNVLLAVGGNMIDVELERRR